MGDYLKLKKSNCKNCYKCIRHCPVKSIKFSDDQAHILEDDCILCGHCFVVCPQNAKQVRDDLPAAKALLQGSAPVYASVAPSFVANYEGATIETMERALKQLGFAGVEETALGATLVKREYDRMAEAGDMDTIITSCCPTVNLLIRKYYPEALPYLAKVKTPMQAHCTDIKARHPEAKTVFIGPCISKKAEADDVPGLVDCVLTYEELTAWLDEAGIQIEKEEANDQAGRARSFPTCGGIIRSMDCKNQDYTYFAVDGIENCMRVLEDVTKGGGRGAFVEMSACAGSCVSGPILDKRHSLLLSDYQAVDRYTRPVDFDIPQPEPQALFHEYTSLKRRSFVPGETSIREVLSKIGKSSPADELNCGCCGYDTCREKAIAVLSGKADLNMCLPFLLSKAESFSDTIIKNTPNAILVVNEAMEVQQINAAACKLFNVSDPRNVLGDQVVHIMDPMPFIQAYTQEKNIAQKGMYLADYKKYVDINVIYAKSYHILICTMRDVTEDEKAKVQKAELSRTTIEITDKVIEKQMRAVQEIASLLGETTAETKVALTKLKESLENV